VFSSGYYKAPTPVSLVDVTYILNEIMKSGVYVNSATEHSPSFYRALNNYNKQTGSQTTHNETDTVDSRILTTWYLLERFSLQAENESGQSVHRTATRAQLDLLAELVNQYADLSSYSGPFLKSRLNNLISKTTIVPQSSTAYEDLTIDKKNKQDGK
jgi:hypothetical protein